MQNTKLKQQQQQQQQQKYAIENTYYMCVAEITKNKMDSRIFMQVGDKTSIWRIDFGFIYHTICFEYSLYYLANKRCRPNH